MFTFIGRGSMALGTCSIDGRKALGTRFCASHQGHSMSFNFPSQKLDGWARSWTMGSRGAEKLGQNQFSLVRNQILTLCSLGMATDDSEAKHEDIYYIYGFLGIPLRSSEPCLGGYDRKKLDIMVGMAKRAWKLATLLNHNARFITTRDTTETTFLQEAQNISPLTLAVNQSMFDRNLLEIFHCQFQSFPNLNDHTTVTFTNMDRTRITRTCGRCTRVFVLLMDDVYSK